MTVIQIVRKLLTPDEVSNPNQRYNADCDCVQTSYDGGTTWTDTPSGDPRHFPGNLFPPVVADDPQCLAAGNMTDRIKFLLDTIITSATIFGAATGVINILLVILPGAGILIDLVLAIAEALFEIGLATVNAALTSDVYDQLACIIYCQLDASGQCSAGAYAVIRGRVDSEIGGVAAIAIDYALDQLGEVGLSNAGTIGESVRACDECPVCEWIRVCDFTIDTYFFEALPIADWDPDCTYVAGVGFVTPTDQTRPGFSDHAVQMAMGRLIPDAHFTQIDVEGSVTWGTNVSFTNSVNLLGDGSTLGTLTDPATMPFGFLGSFDSLSTHLDVIGVIGYFATAPGGSMTVSKITLHGTGPEPDIGVPA